MPKPVDIEEDDQDVEINGKNEISNNNSNKLDLALLAFFLTGSIAFNVLLNPHFLMFVKLLNKNYKVPSPYVLSGRVLDAEYAKVMSEIKMELSKMRGCSLTLDPWTCKAQSYPYLGRFNHF